MYKTHTASVSYVKQTCFSVSCDRCNYLDAVERLRLDVDAEARDAIDRLLQLVRPGILLGRVLQVVGAERAQQQRKEQVQHLTTDKQK